MPISADTPKVAAEATAFVTRGFASVFESHQPDILEALGDRLEMHAAVSAAVPFNLFIVYIHGGQTSDMSDWSDP